MANFFDSVEWKIFKSKAPVYQCGHVRKKYLSTVSFYLSKKDRDKISVALDHAQIGEGREEFDLVCKEIEGRRRL